MTETNVIDQKRPADTSRGRRLATATLLTTGVLLVAYTANTAVRSFLWLEPAFGVAIYLLGLLVMAVVWLLANGPWTPVRIAVVTFSLYLTWGLVSGSVPVSDFSSFAADAHQFAKSPSLQLLYESKSPATVLWYSTFSWMLGPTLFSIKLGAAVAWSATSVFLLMLFTELGFARRVASFAALLFGLAPGVVAYSSVISSESVLLLGLVVGLYFVHVVRSESDRRIVGDLVLSSLLFAVAYMAIPSALLFFVAYVIALPFVDIKRRRAGRASLTHMAAFVLPLLAVAAFQISLNYTFDGSFSPSPSPFGAMALLSGTNQETNGAWAIEDMELAGFSGPNRLPFDEASSRALEIAIDRVAEDPLGFAEFAVDEKVTRLWRGEDQLLYWSVQQSEHFDNWYYGSEIYWSLRRLVNGYFAVAVTLVVPAAVLLWRRRLFTLYHFPIGLALLGQAAMFLLIAVQQRYHLLFMPFVFGVVALAWSIVFGGNDPARIEPGSDPRG